MATYARYESRFDELRKVLEGYSRVGLVQDSPDFQKAILSDLAARRTSTCREEMSETEQYAADLALYRVEREITAMIRKSFRNCRSEVAC